MRHEAIGVPSENAILTDAAEEIETAEAVQVEVAASLPLPEVHEITLTQMRSELLSIRGLLTV